MEEQGTATQETVVKTEETKTEAQDPRRFTQADLDSTNASTRRETEKKARETKEAEIADSLGVSIDEAKTLIAERRQQEEASKTELDKVRDKAEKLDGDLKTVKASATSEKERADRYETALTGYLETEREGIPEHLTALLDRMDVVEQLTYISENRAALKPEDEKPEVKRAPDATRRSTVEEKLSPRELVSSAFVKR